MGLNETSASALPRYLARTTAGTEEIAWLDLQRLPSARLVALGRRRIEFEYSGSVQHLLTLQSVDDVYVWVGRLRDLNRSRLSLRRIAQQITSLPLSAAVQVCRQVRTVSDRPSFAVTASLVGRRNYSRYDVADAIRDGLGPHCDWTFVENKAGALPTEIDLRILIEGQEGHVGVRLGKSPLHRRAYKVRNRPGSLKPPVAYCLVLLAGIRPGETVLDPMCGVGTIPIEAATAFDAGSVWGLDNDAATVYDALRNAHQAEADVRFLNGDATQLPFSDGCVDGIVCNLPWGKQAQTQRSLRETYASALAEFSRVLRQKGRAVLLTDRTGLLLQRVERQPDLHLAFARQISLFGSHPTICVLTRSRDAPDLLQPFQGAEPLAQRLNELAQRWAIENLNHSDFRIRLHAVQACARLRDPKAIPELRPLLDDEDGRVRRATAEALEQMPVKSR
jgi:tRNA (guanine6-N2)-methyltransferase